LGFLEFLLHGLDLSLVNVDFTWGKDWCFDEVEVWLAKNKKLVLMAMI
jgi:hypothetical protein